MAAQVPPQPRRKAMRLSFGTDPLTDNPLVDSPTAAASTILHPHPHPVDCDSAAAAAATTATIATPGAPGASASTYTHTTAMTGSDAPSPPAPPPSAISRSAHAAAMRAMQVCRDMEAFTDATFGHLSQMFGFDEGEDSEFTAAGTTLHGCAGADVMMGSPIPVAAATPVSGVGPRRGSGRALLSSFVETPTYRSFSMASPAGANMTPLADHMHALDLTHGDSSLCRSASFIDTIVEEEDCERDPPSLITSPPANITVSSRALLETSPNSARHLHGHAGAPATGGLPFGCTPLAMPTLRHTFSPTNRFNKRASSATEMGTCASPPPLMSPSVSCNSLDCLDQRPQCRLPVIECSKNPDLNWISADTVKALLDGEFAETVGKFIIVDCRFPYEFAGGHIRGAVNFFETCAFENHFFNSPLASEAPIIIFHCEFSSHRAPKLTRFMRNRDRTIHKMCYPQLFFPELYVIKDGYRNFHAEHPSYCVPHGGYITMDNTDFAEDLRRHNGVMRASYNAANTARAPRPARVSRSASDVPPSMFDHHDPF